MEVFAVQILLDCFYSSLCLVLVPRLHLSSAGVFYLGLLDSTS